MGSGVIAVESNGTIQLANKQAGIILNQSKEDIIGYSVEMLPKEIYKMYRMFNELYMKVKTLVMGLYKSAINAS